MRTWRCFARCWSCGGEVDPQRATRSAAERPLTWSCPACEVRWVADARPHRGPDLRIGMVARWR